MTQEEFIEELNDRGYSYEIEGDKIVVTHNGNAYLDSLTSLPPGVVFSNKWDVWLNLLDSIPSSVEFRNGGHVCLDSLPSIPIGVEFNNKGDVNLSSLIGGFLSGWFSNWNDNIEGIDSKRLLNLMIKGGMFI